MIEAVQQRAVRWVPVGEFPAYQVSDTGELRDARGVKCATWMSHGSLYVQVKDESGTRHKRLVRLLVLAAFGPKRPSGWRSRNKGAPEACGIRDVEWYRPAFKHVMPNNKGRRVIERAVSGRVSSSFSAEQAKLLDNLLHALVCDRDARLIARQHRLTLSDLSKATSRMRVAAARREELREKQLAEAKRPRRLTLVGA